VKQKQGGLGVDFKEVFSELLEKVEFDEDTDDLEHIFTDYFDDLLAGENFDTQKVVVSKGFADCGNAMD
jgi:hypothetical protein